MKAQVQNPLLFYFLICFQCLLLLRCHADTLLNRSSFPADFVFGTASSAYQYEGAAHIEGRKPSIWDTFTKDQPEKILDHSNGDVAVDFYHHYKEDVDLLKEVGFDSFRFSISWSRVLPLGKVSGGVNQQGVEFYNNLIDELISNGIKPFVTLFHWDLPQALEDEYGGLLSPEIVKDFYDYADFCFKQFGDRVKHWITVNEPNLFSNLGYATGIFAPGRCSTYIGNCPAGNSATEPYLVAHHLLLCHATAVNLYRKNYEDSQKGIIGITIYVLWAVPRFQTLASNQAASRAIDFMIGWILDPITYGSYPKIMQSSAGNRLPKFTKSQYEMIKGSTDFFGLNYYTTFFADDMKTYSSINLSYSTDDRVNLTNKKGFPIGEPTGSERLYFYPKGLQDMLLYVKKNYKAPPIYITENGMGDVNSSSWGLNVALNDTLRIKYHHIHLSYLLKAIKDGVDVRGYYAWSFLDNFEWYSGYTLRYGITFVDYKNKLKRSLKSSALWFKNFLQKEYVSTLSSSKLYSDQ